MGSFRYRAVTADGAPVAGALIADSVGDARAKLRERRLFPESVEPLTRVRPRLRDALPGARSRNAAHVALFTRQFALLIETGVPIAEAMAVLARQAEDRAFARCLSEIHEEVNAGASLADALSAYPHLFDRAYVGMVASGEKSGAMDIVCSRLADFLERRRVLQTKIGTAFVYPSILLAMVVGLLVFLSGVVTPQIRPLLEQQGRPVPFASWLLFRLGDGVRDYGWFALLLIAALAAGLAWFRRTPSGGRLCDRLLLRIPLLGPVLRKGLVSRFAMSFATLVRTGVPALEALEMLNELTPNAALAGEIAAIRNDVIEGGDISDRMQRSALFPPMVGYMAAVGERSGKLADVMDQVARAYDMEVEIASRRFVAALEPALILVMAAAVGFVALSLMTTILQLSSF